MNIHYPNDKSTIGISCLLIVTEKNRDKLDYSLECYQKQKYANRELIIVAPASFKSFLENISFPLDSSIIYHDGEIPSMRNVGIEACTRDYVFKWNHGDWYHPSLLSLLANKCDNGNQEFISLASITGYNGSKIVTLYSRCKGWEETIIVKRNMMIPYPEGTNSDTLHLNSQWYECGQCLVLEPEYACLCIKMNHKIHEMDTPITQSMEQYHRENALAKPTVTPIVKVIPTTTQMIPYVSSNTHWLWSSMQYMYTHVTSYLIWPKVLNRMRS
jgi:hypothetical protein